MVSQQSGREIKTECADCYFYDNDSCADNRIKKFDSLKRLKSTDPPVIKGFCSLKRTEEWGNQQENALEEAKKQLQPKFGISVINLEEDFDPEKVKDQLLGIDYDQKNIGISLTFNKVNVEKKLKCFEEIRTKFDYAEMNIVLTDNIYTVETQNFSYLGSFDYFVSLKKNATIPKDLFAKVDKIINQDLENYAFYDFDCKNGVPSTIIFKRVVRATYLEYCDYRFMEKNLRSETKSNFLYCNLDEK